MKGRLTAVGIGAIMGAFVGAMHNQYPDNWFWGWKYIPTGAAGILIDATAFGAIGYLAISARCGSFSPTP